MVSASSPDCTVIMLNAELAELYVQTKTAGTTFVNYVQFFTIKTVFNQTLYALLHPTIIALSKGSFLVYFKVTMEYDKISATRNMNVAWCVFAQLHPF